MMALKSLAALAALSLVPNVHAWYEQLPPCLSPFQPFLQVGCYDNGLPTEMTALSEMFDKSPDMTVEKCVATCKGNGFRYAGLAWRDTCYCGQTVDKPEVNAATECNLECAGNSSQTCGGDTGLNIYTDTTFLPVDEQTIAEYRPLGCYTDNNPEAKKALFFRQTQLDNEPLTTEICLEACRSKGFPFAGTEFSSECYCGVAIGNGTVHTDDGNCQRTCTGNNDQFCGGAGHINLYVLNDLISLEPCGYTPPQSSSTASSAVSTTSSTVAVSSSTSTTSTSPTSSSTSSTQSSITSTSTLNSTPTSSTISSTSSSTTYSTSTSTSSTTSTPTSTPTSSTRSSTTSSTTYSTSTSTSFTTSTYSTRSSTSSTTSSTTAVSSTTSTSSTRSSTASTTAVPSTSASSTRSTTTSTTSSVRSSTASTTSSVTSTSRGYVTSSTTSTRSTQRTSTTTSPAMCTSRVVTAPTCEYQCGRFCSQPLPDFEDSNSCLTAWSQCAIQIATCFKYAGWPDAMDCFNFYEWCDGIKEYCKGNSRGSKGDCYKKLPPQYPDGSRPTTSTTAFPCTSAPTSTTSTSIKPTSSCPVPTPTGICIQPTSRKYDGPVGGIKLPVLTCNNIEADYNSRSKNVFKLYTESNSKNCKSYPRDQSDNACQEACTVQFNQCSSVYAQGCRTGGKDSSGRIHGEGYKSPSSRKRGRNYSEATGMEKRTGANRWSRGYDDASRDCQMQYDDCKRVNRGIDVRGKCQKFGEGY
ncbi:WSC domain-containing protein [Pseudomassariella vexata]|uniref:WSC domain-domain-containing protein n=1 Tax=Pseudomassariella vexata TaxID=1141098 RepID=A0A1Y2DWE6_9PEZI|nr:WSC domain-containing protein [Pseudomassariella vexata]ORY63434.1 WSC domain-domain-containing protein [Pseudomassariella vexata]